MNADNDTAQARLEKLEDAVGGFLEQLPFAANDLEEALAGFFARLPISLSRGRRHEPKILTKERVEEIRLEAADGKPILCEDVLSLVASIAAVEARYARATKMIENTWTALETVDLCDAADTVADAAGMAVYERDKTREALEEERATTDRLEDAIGDAVFVLTKAKCPQEAAIKRAVELLEDASDFESDPPKIPNLPGTSCDNNLFDPKIDSCVTHNGECAPAKKLALGGYQPDCGPLSENVVPPKGGSGLGPDPQTTNQVEDFPLVHEVTRIVRLADQDFTRTGGSSRHWVRDQFLPRLNEAGFYVARRHLK